MNARFLLGNCARAKRAKDGDRCCPRFNYSHGQVLSTLKCFSDDLGIMARGTSICSARRLADLSAMATLISMYTQRLVMTQSGHRLSPWIFIHFSSCCDSSWLWIFRSSSSNCIFILLSDITNYQAHFLVTGCDVIYDPLL